MPRTAASMIRVGENFTSLMMSRIDAMVDKHCSTPAELRRIGATPDEIRAAVEKFSPKPLIQPYERPRQKGQLEPIDSRDVERVEQYLRQHRAGSAPEISAVTGLGLRQVGACVSRLIKAGQPVEREWVSPCNRRRYIWKGGK